MIEIKIPTSAASLLLTERMQHEFNMRQNAGYYGEGLDLYDLNYRELFEIAEIAAFDLVFLLPAEIFSEKNNLAEIITKSIRSLGKSFDCYEFEFYGKQQAKWLIKPIADVFSNANENKTFLTN